MFARIKVSLQKDPNKRAIVITGALLILAAVIAVAFSHVTRNLSGEGFYDFQYPYRLPFAESWRTFFLERIRARLMHGVFISALFSITGYNPPAIYFGVYVLAVSTAVLIALNLVRFVHRPWQAALLTLTLALLPVVIPELLELKKAHHVLAWFIFWLAVSFIRMWIRTERRRWLLAGTLAFLASVLAYEATIALLPLAVLLSIEELKDFRDLWRKFGIVSFITLCSAIAFLRLEDLKEYTGIGFAYPGFSDPAGAITKLFAAVPDIAAAIWRGEIFGALPASLVAVGIALGLGCLAVTLFSVYSAVAKRRRWNFAVLQQPPVFLTLAALFLTIATYLPFMLAGQQPDADSLRGAAIGLVLLSIASLHSRIRLAAVVFAAIMGFLLIAGLRGYLQADRAAAADDARLNRFITTLRQQIPGVRSGANFVFVNSGVGRTGCIGLMNMLYGRSDLHCIHLFDDDLEEGYIREVGGLQEVGGRLFDSGFILLTMAPDGSAVVLDQISREDFPNVPILWSSDLPLMPDESVLLFLSSAYVNPTKPERAGIKMLMLQPPSAIYDYVAGQVSP